MWAGLSQLSSAAGGGVGATASCLGAVPLVITKRNTKATKLSASYSCRLDNLCVCGGGGVSVIATTTVLDNTWYWPWVALNNSLGSGAGHGSKWRACDSEGICCKHWLPLL